MPVEVEGPDGTVIEFPDGTAPETIKGVMAKRYPRKAQTTYEGKTFDFDVADNATEAQIQEGSLNAIRKQYPDANLPAASQVGVTQQPTVGEALYGAAKDFATNTSAGFAGALDFLSTPGRLLNEGIDSGINWLSRGGRPDAEGFDVMGGVDRRSASEMVRSLNPGADERAHGALAQEFLGAALVPFPKIMPKAPAYGYNALAKAEQSVAQPAVSAAAKSVNPAAREIVEAGKREGVRVMRSDIKPPSSFLGKAAQKFGENIPVVGTGGFLGPGGRTAQQAERIAAVERLVAEYGEGTSGAAVDAVSADLLATRGAQLGKLAKTKQDILDRVPGIATAPKAIAEINNQIARLSGINPEAFAPVIAKLENFKTELANGKTLAQIEGNRKLLGDLFSDPSLAAIKGDGQKALNAIYGPLREDMGDFIARTMGDDTRAVWKRTNDRLSAMAGDLDSRAFKSVLNSAETTPEAAAKIIFGKNPSDMRRLYASLSETGRLKARSAIVYKAAEGATNPETGVISPKQFANALAKMGEASGTFMEPAEKVRIDGLARLLQATQRAADASVMTNSGQQAVPYLMAGGAMSGGAAPMAIYGIAARIYENTGVRGHLVRIARTKPGSKAEEAALADASSYVARMIPVAANHAEGALAASPGRAAAQDETDSRREPPQ
jgi:hypothetical protein